MEIENPQENNSRKFDDVKKLNNVVSKATYKSIYDGIDLEYILVGNNIKENIIVNDKQEEYKYSFEIKLNKLNAELKNNEIILTDSDTGEKVYEIPAPYMLDANGGIHILLKEKVSVQDENLFYAVADVILDAEKGFLKDQLGGDYEK